MKTLIKKTALGITVLLLFWISLSISQNVVYAQPGAIINRPYQPLAPLPQKFFEGAIQSENGKNDLPRYLQGMFKILIAISILLSVIMIILGGVQYMSTDAMEDKHDGKGKITNAVMGLILALVSWLILYTINPALLQFKINENQGSSRGTVETSPNPTSAPSDDTQGNDTQVPGSSIRGTEHLTP